MAGRPSKFTPEVTDKILYAIRLGAYYEMACNYAGCSYELMRQWIRDANDNPETSPYLAFVDALKEAEGQSGVRALEVIQNAMDGEVWQSAAWRLERRHHKHFSANAAVIELAGEIHDMKDQLKKGNSNGKVVSIKKEKAPKK